MTKPSSIFARGYAALEAEDLDGLQAAVEAALDADIDEYDPRLRYLDFMASWLDEDTEEELLEASFANLGEILEGGSALDDPAEAARVVLDLADIAVELGEIDAAEHALRALIEREDLEAEAEAEARLLHAQVLLEFLEDAEEAFEVLDGVDPSLHQSPGYVSLRAALLVELERADEGIELLEQAIEGGEVELRYQLGLILRGAGRTEDALEHMLEIRTHDLARHGIDPDRPVSGAEAADLRRYLEDVLDTLPEPVLQHGATAAIRVERWPSEEAVRQGCDPRTGLAFEGQPAGEEGEEQEGQVEAMVLYRDAVVAQIEDDDEIPEVLALSLVEEIDRFFELELFPGV